MAAGGARGQSALASLTGAESEEDQLAREVDDPTAILTQLKFQDLYTPRNFQTTAQTNTLQLRPVLPVEPFSLIPFEQIIRPTFEVQTIATSRGSSTITEVADMQLFDLFLSNGPTPSERVSAGASGQLSCSPGEEIQKRVITHGRSVQQPLPFTVVFHI
jgi:hypothetical protein